MAKRYCNGQIETGSNRVTADALRSAETILALVRRVAEDFNEVAFEGNDDMETGIQCDSSVTHEKTRASLELAMNAFIGSPDTGAPS